MAGVLGGSGGTDAGGGGGSGGKGRVGTFQYANGPRILDVYIGTKGGGGGSGNNSVGGPGFWYNSNGGRGGESDLEDGLVVEVEVVLSAILDRTNQSVVEDTLSSEVAVEVVVVHLWEKWIWRLETLVIGFQNQPIGISNGHHGNTKSSGDGGGGGGWCWSLWWWSWFTWQRQQ